MNQPNENLKDSILQALGVKEEDKLTNEEWDKVNESLDIFVKSCCQDKFFSRNVIKDRTKIKTRNSLDKRACSHSKNSQKSKASLPFYKHTNSRRYENRRSAISAQSYNKSRNNSKKSLQSEIDQFEERLKSSSGDPNLETTTGEGLWLHDLAESGTMKLTDTEKCSTHAWEDRVKWEGFIDLLHEITTLGNKSYDNLEKATAHAIEKMASIGSSKSQDLTKNEQYRLLVIQKALHCLEERLIEEHKQKLPKLFGSADHSRSPHRKGNHPESIAD